MLGRFRLRSRCWNILVTKCMYIVFFILIVFFMVFHNKNSQSTEVASKKDLIDSSPKIQTTLKTTSGTIKARDFREFSYPLNVNITELVKKRIDKKMSTESIQTINAFPFKFLITPLPCFNFSLLFLVKSRVDHYDHRKAIRKTWGTSTNSSHIAIKTVFVLGKNPGSRNVSIEIYRESEENGDILLLDMDDSYYNNTYKVIGAMKWAVSECFHEEFIVFLDDDFFVAPKRLFSMLQKLLPDEKKNLFMGFLFSGFGPHRDKSSKWYISVSDYPSNRYPDFLAAGTMVMSNYSLKRLQIASEYVKWYPFDDVFLGLVAYKLGIKPKGHKGFYNYRLMPSSKIFNMVLTAHGYPPSVLLKVWNKANLD